MSNYRYVEIKDEDIVEGAVFYHVTDESKGTVLAVDNGKVWLKNCNILGFEYIKTNYRKRVEKPVKKLYAYRLCNTRFIQFSTREVSNTNDERVSEFDIIYEVGE